MLGPPRRRESVLVFRFIWLASAPRNRFELRNMKPGRATDLRELASLTVSLVRAKMSGPVPRTRTPKEQGLWRSYMLMSEPRKIGVVVLATAVVTGLLWFFVFSGSRKDARDPPTVSHGLSVGKIGWQIGWQAIRRVVCFADALRMFLENSCTLRLVFVHADLSI